MIFELLEKSHGLALSILGLLVAMSVLSWTIILAKMLQFWLISLHDRRFRRAYQRESTLSTLSQLALRLSHSPLARMFETSHTELHSFRNAAARGGRTNVSHDRVVHNLSRSLERMRNQQGLRLQSGLPVLAMISGSAPFIGLFGTVLGIIDAFSAISAQGVTSLSVVAPGIAEALLATAAGLAAAIPSLIAYNMFRDRLRSQGVKMRNFGLDMVNRMERIL